MRSAQKIMFDLRLTGSKWAGPGGKDSEEPYPLPPDESQVGILTAVHEFAEGVREALRKLEEQCSLSME